MSITASARTIAAEREQAASELQGALELAGRAYVRFNKLTAALSNAIGQDLSLALDTGINMHAQANGLGPLLERKLVGAASPLADLCAEHHRKMSIE